MRELYTKIKNAIKFGFTTRYTPDTENVPIVEVSYLKKPGKLAELISPYGLSVGLPANTQVLVFSVGGVEGRRVAIGWSQIDRFKNLNEGEVVLGNPKTGAHIKFDERGNIRIEAKDGNGDVIIIAQRDLTIDVTRDIRITVGKDFYIDISGGKDMNIEVDRDINIEAGRDVNIDAQQTNLGVGGNQIARIGDTVQVNTTTGIGTITSGGINTSI